MTDLTPHKPDTMVDGRSRKGRISPEIRKAIKLRVEEGHTITQACAAAGICEAAWYKAMKRPHVAAYIESESLRFIREVDRRRARYKAQALEIGAHLLHNAKSEQVKARMVEFFAGEAKQALVSIDLSGNPRAASGYAYRRPDQAPRDIQSSPENPQGIDDAEELGD
jgi:hypothetical protein